MLKELQGKTRYIRQLDAIRAIAVSFVIVDHWIYYDTKDHIPLANLGVNTFFVLSGYLITQILLESRNIAENSATGKFKVLRFFYIRRVLRIFPIYYLTIFTLLISSINVGPVKPAFFSLLTYTVNLYFFFTNAWGGLLSHMWSLAVEEQFYLFWPFIVLFIKKNYLLHVIIVFIITGVVSQCLLKDYKLGNVFTSACFDCFGFGALLAWQTIYKQENLKNFYFRLSFFALISFVFFVVGVIQNSWTYFPPRMLNGVIGLWVITYIVYYNQEGKLEAKLISKLILNNRLLIFLGTISYGIYLYQLFPVLLNSSIARYIHPLYPDFINDYSQQLLFIEDCIILILISWLSYILFEKRFLNLKKHFSLQVKY